MDPKYKAAYKRLGLDDAGASWEQVRQHYRRQVQRLHPDRQENNHASASHDEFIQVTRAYKLLNEYHRKNDALPSDYRAQSDPVMQMDLGDFDKITYSQLSEAMESIEHRESSGLRFLKIALLSVALALLAAIALMSFSSWQKAQVPPVTPFTADEPQPLSPAILDDKP